jgi:DNA-binding NtrC family response regulator
MGSKSVSGWAAGPRAIERIALISTNERNVDMMAEALPEYDHVVATKPSDLNPVMTGSIETGLVVVDTENVTDDVTALLKSLHERELPVLLLAKNIDASLREQVVKTRGMAFKEKPVRADGLRTFVAEAFE